jgi:hypothetical protein
MKRIFTDLQNDLADLVEGGKTGRFEDRNIPVSSSSCLQFFCPPGAEFGSSSLAER